MKMSNLTISFHDYPILPDHEVRRLLKEAQSGSDAARQKLVECNLRLVRSIVMRFAHRDAEMDDLFQIGCIGLIKAIDDFDLSYDVKFSTYAVPKIIGEIKRYLREASPMKISRSLRELASRALAVKDNLASELGRPPLIGEIAGELGVSKEELIAALEAVAPVMSLQQVILEDEGEGVRLEAQIGSEPDGDVLYLKDVLQSLEPDERRLLLLRYFAEQSQVEVAKIFGVSQAHISRIEKRILNELRNKLETKG